jgi:cation diffusion facilitator family transporter
MRTMRTSMTTTMITPRTITRTTMARTLTAVPPTTTIMPTITMPIIADHNLLAAYVHVLADALTSVLAIAALVAGRYLGWVWLDAAMGLVGAAVILRWSISLMGQTARVLLDSADPSLIKRVKERLEKDGACVSDLHIWRLGPGHSAVVATVVCPSGNKPDHFKEKLSEVPTLSHVTVEVLEPKR